MIIKENYILISTFFNINRFTVYFNIFKIIKFVFANMEDEIVMVEERYLHQL